jgi:hypothetical protein
MVLSKHLGERGGRKMIELKLTTIPLEQYFNNTPLGQGTGFIWMLREQYYLVTNWHVLSMRDFFDDKNLRDDGQTQRTSHSIQYSNW